MFKLLQTDGLGSKCKDRKNKKNFDINNNIKLQLKIF